MSLTIKGKNVFGNNRCNVDFVYTADLGHSSGPWLQWVLISFHPAVAAVL